MSNYLKKALKDKDELRSSIKNIAIEQEMSYLKDKQILVIDDSIETLNLIEKFCNLFKLSSVKTAINEIEAIQKITEDRPDLIIIDIMLPSINGFSMGSIVREICKVDTPILYITSNRSFKKDLQLLDDSNFDYMFKPIDINLLKEKIKKLL